jgi:hypothetical protein
MPGSCNYTNCLYHILRRNPELLAVPRIRLDDLEQAFTNEEKCWLDCGFHDTFLPQLEQQGVLIVDRLRNEVALTDAARDGFGEFEFVEHEVGAEDRLGG